MNAEQEQPMASLLHVDLQCEVDMDGTSTSVPTLTQFQAWANLAYRACEASIKPAELSLCIVDEKKMTSLNEQYRGKPKPTNVLSFPFSNAEEDAVMSEAMAELPVALLGDIVVCWPVIEHEASQQDKAVHDHAAHMVIHGVLHLCGYDHDSDEQATVMESMEVQLLSSLDISNPYL